MNIDIRFVPRTGGPDNLVAEAELVFDDNSGAFNGIKIVGVSLWNGHDGDIRVTFPARAYSSGNERRFYSYIRGEKNGESIKPLKDWIVQQYREQKGS